MHNIPVDAPCEICLRVCRDTEYKGLQLSLEQVTSKASFPYNSSMPSSLEENRRTTKSRVSRPKAKARLSPYTQVRLYFSTFVCRTVMNGKCRPFHGIAPKHFHGQSM